MERERTGTWPRSAAARGAARLRALVVAGVLGGALCACLAIPGPLTGTRAAAPLALGADPATDTPANPAIDVVADQVRYNAKGEPLVANTFSDTELRQALWDIASETGVHIVADATVQGTVTAAFKDEPLERVLTRLLLPGGYAFARIDDYYLVGLPDPSNPNYHLLSETVVIKLQYTEPQAVLAALSGVYGKYLSAEGVPATINPPTDPMGMSGRTGGLGGGPALGGPAAKTTRLNSRIVITAPRSMIARIRADIAQIDQPRRQVMLEAMVMEVSDQALRELGVDWASKFLRFDLTSGGANLIYSSIANTELVALTALTTKGSARVRANPRVSTSEGETAELEVGKESYFSITTGPSTYPYSTLEKITSGILFRITPQVVDDTGEVIARVEPEVRDVTGQSKNGLPEITFRRSTTTVRVPDGQSIVIGGLVSEFDIRSTSKVPVLGDIPLVGNLFRRSSTRQTKSEVVIIITPRLMDDGGTPGQSRANRLRREMGRASAPSPMLGSSVFAPR